LVQLACADGDRWTTVGFEDVTGISSIVGIIPSMVDGWEKSVGTVLASRR
jgi:hypothetical protein